MSRPRADTLQRAPRINLGASDVLEAEGQWGANEALPAGFGIEHGSPSSGRGEGGEVVQHDLYGDYDEDSGGGSPTPPSTSNTESAATKGVRITRQEGFTYTNTNSDKAVNRWSIENNVALLVLKKELQIDRSAVRERRVAKKLDQTMTATPRALAGSMTPRGSGFNNTGTISPRTNSLLPSQPHSGTSVGGGNMSPRGNASIFLDFARLGNSTVNGLASLDGGASEYQLPPPVIVTMPDATLLSKPLQAEVEFLKHKCSELISIAGIQSGEDIVSATRNMHRRIHLLNEQVIEELSNRIDYTSAAIRKRDTTRDILAKEAGLTQTEMGDAFALSKIVSDCYEMQADALAVIKRLHSLRMIHQEAFQRVGALSLLRSASLDTHNFISNAPDEIEEMRLGTKEVSGAVNESLTYFRQRLQALGKA